jgi:RNA polymerase sigma-32 factor
MSAYDLDVKVEEEKFYSTDSPLGVLTYATKRKLLTPEEEKEYAIRYLTTGDKTAWDELVLANIGFVVKIAKEFKHYNLPLNDLVSEGYCGLMDAIKRFDPSKGYRLVTFAVWWIKAKIKDYIVKNWSLVKYGTTTSQRKMFFKVGSIGECETEEERWTRICELAKTLDLSPEEVSQEERRIRERIISLSEITSRTDDASMILGDVLVSNSFELQDSQLEARDEKEWQSDMLKAALSDLSEREQFVIGQRYLSEDRWTLAEIGEYLGVSRERVRQMEVASLRKMKKHCECYLTRHDLFDQVFAA